MDDLRLQKPRQRRGVESLIRRRRNTAAGPVDGHDGVSIYRDQSQSKAKGCQRIDGGKNETSYTPCNDARESRNDLDEEICWEKQDSHDFQANDGRLPMNDALPLELPRGISYDENYDDAEFYEDEDDRSHTTTESVRDILESFQQTTREWMLPFRDEELISDLLNQEEDNAETDITLDPLHTSKTCDNLQSSSVIEVQDLATDLIHFDFLETFNTLIEGLIEAPDSKPDQRSTTLSEIGRYILDTNIMNEIQVKEETELRDDVGDSFDTATTGKDDFSPSECSDASEDSPSECSTILDEGSILHRIRKADMEMSKATNQDKHAVRQETSNRIVPPDESSSPRPTQAIVSEPSFIAGTEKEMSSGQSFWNPWRRALNTTRRTKNTTYTNRSSVEANGIPRSTEISGQAPIANADRGRKTFNATNEAKSTSVLTRQHNPSPKVQLQRDISRYTSGQEATKSDDEIARCASLGRPEWIQVSDHDSLDDLVATLEDQGAKGESTEGSAIPQRRRWRLPWLTRKTTTRKKTTTWSKAGAPPIVSPLASIDSSAGSFRNQ